MGTFGSRGAGRYCDSSHQVAWPAITSLVLIYVIAGWALVTGAFEIVAAARLRKHIAGEWLLAIGGASIIFSILIAIAPFAGALVIAL